MSHDSTTAPKTAAAFSAELEAFSGSLTQYRHPFGLRFTEGVHHLLTEIAGVVRENGERCNGAFWFLDAISSHQPAATKTCDGFQLWTLEVANDGNGPGATLTCRADSDQPAVITQEIEYTDFPLPRVTLYVIDGVALLPGEY